MGALHGVGGGFLCSPHPNEIRQPVSLRMGMGALRDSRPGRRRIGTSAARGDSSRSSTWSARHLSWDCKVCQSRGLRTGRDFGLSRTCCRSFRTSSIRSVRSGVICRFFCLVFETWNACPIARPPTSRNPFASIKLKAGPLCPPGDAGTPNCHFLPMTKRSFYIVHLAYCAQAIIRARRNSHAVHPCD